MKKMILPVLGFLAIAISAFVPSGSNHSRVAYPAVPASNTTGTRADIPANRTVIANPPFQTSMWTIDKAHTSLKFSVSHLVISDVEGNFKIVDGTMESSKADFSDAKITLTAEVKSISTDNDQRDTHLKSNDFFNADSFPQIKFVSTNFTPLGNNKYKLVGNLTIRNVTKPVTFDVKYGGTVNMYGTHVGFKATTKIDRKDYNLKFAGKTSTGEAVVGDDVDITVNVDFKKS